MSHELHANLISHDDHHIYIGRGQAKHKHKDTYVRTDGSGRARGLRDPVTLFYYGAV